MVRATAGGRLLALFLAALAFALATSAHAANPYDSYRTGYALPNAQLNFTAMTRRAGGDSAHAVARFDGAVVRDGRARTHGAVPA